MRHFVLVAVVYIISFTTVLAFHYTNYSMWPIAVFAVSFVGANILRDEPKV